MELNGLGREFESIEQAEAAGLRSYELIPMSGNMQMIIYKPTDPKADWLVKVLLNEREVTLPVEPVTAIITAGRHCASIILINWRRSKKINRRLIVFAHQGFCNFVF